jgi:hypothetical protein
MNEQANQLQELDEFLAKATWPVVTQAQIDRLASIYRREQWKSSLRQWGTLAAAAVLMICMGIWTHRLTRPYPTQPLARETTTTTPPPATIVSRDANLLERAILLSAAPKQSVHAPSPRPAPPRDALNSAIIAIAGGADSTRVAQKLNPNFVNYAALLKQPPRYAVPLYLAMVQNPATSDDALAALYDVPRAAIDEFFTHLDDPHVATRMAAARVLGKIDGPVITRKLATMVSRDQNRREALAALISSDGVQAEQFVAQAKRDARLAPTIHALESELKTPL